VDGTYYVAVTTNQSGLSYTLNATVVGDASPVAIPAGNIPGTPIQINTPVTSLIDVNTNPRDVFAVDLHRGQSISFVVNTKGNATIEVANPKSTSFDAGYIRATIIGANGGTTAPLTISVDGTYYVAVTTNQSGLSYTLNATVVSDASPVAIPAGDIPGTPIQINTPVTSLIDVNIKPRDVFAVDLQTGQAVSFDVNTKGNATIEVATPKSTSFDGGGYTRATIVGANGGTTARLNVAESGIYYVAITTGQSGLSYSLKITISP
jgi:hypothetical protein